MKGFNMNHINWTENVVDIIESRIDGCDDANLVDEIGLVSTYIEILRDENGYVGADVEKLVRQDASGGRLGATYYKDMRNVLRDCEMEDVEWLDDETICKTYREMLVSTVMHMWNLEYMEKYM